MFQITPRLKFMKLFSDNRPRAVAEISGSADYSDVKGFVHFYEVPYGGILIEAEVFGLPGQGGMDISAFYGFHIHEMGDCSENFTKTGSHYNPQNMEHPYHAGDLPPLFSHNGYAWLAFYDYGLELYDVMDKSVVIHRNADDFTTQPAGNAGEKIGCGVIKFIESL